MISRENFIFTIGYEGNTAVVDGSLKKRYKSLSTMELAEKGLFKQALCSAIYESQSKALTRQRQALTDQRQALEQVLNVYNIMTESKLKSTDELKRIFGVFEVPEGIGKVMVI